MQFLLALLVGLMLVSGQSLWKAAIVNLTGGSNDFIALLHEPFRLFFNPLFLLGVGIYIVATLLYMYVISKYSYGVSYAMIVACSTILASIVSVSLFRETFSAINIVGLVLIISGITLVVHH